MLLPLVFSGSFAAQLFKICRPRSVVRFAFGAVAIERGGKFRRQGAAAIRDTVLELRSHLRMEAVDRCARGRLEISQENLRRAFKLPCAFV